MYGVSSHFDPASILFEHVVPIQASSKLELYRKSEGPQSRIFVTYFGPCRREGACPAAA